MTQESGPPASREEKKAQTLRVAMEEFSRCGYSGASTNTITRRAGISKGMLFHYFGSKKELFLRLLEDAVRRLAGSAEAAPGEGRGSLSDTMAALFRSKADYFLKAPLDMGLLERAQLEQSKEVRAEIVRVLTELAAVMRRRRREAAERAVDGARLRPGVTREQALECVMLALEALDGHFYAQYRGRGEEVMSNPAPILETTRLFLDAVSRGLFAE